MRYSRRVQRISQGRDQGVSEPAASRKPSLPTPDGRVASRGRSHYASRSVACRHLAARVPGSHVMLVAIESVPNRYSNNRSCVTRNTSHRWRLNCLYRAYAGIGRDRKHDQRLATAPVDSHSAGHFGLVNAFRTAVGGCLHPFSSRMTFRSLCLACSTRVTARAKRTCMREQTLLIPDVFDLPISVDRPEQFCTFGDESRSRLRAGCLDEEPLQERRWFIVVA